MASAEDSILPLTSPTRPSHSFQTLDGPTLRPAHRMRLLDLTVHVPPSSSKAGPQSTRKQSVARWNTLEFRLYYVAVVVVLPIMVWIPYSLSRTSNPNYPLFQRRLSPGWMFGRRVDNSDGQYRSFRNNIPILSVVALAFTSLRYIWNRASAKVSRSTTAADNMQMVPFHLIFSIIFLVALHGTSALKVMAILYANYSIAKLWAGTRWGPLCIWVFNAVVLLANDRYNGYRFGHILPPLEFLDSFTGVYPRWHVSFNITMLRLVSFGMDLHWARLNGVTEVGASSVLSDRERQTISHPEEMYSFRNYVCYVLYSPLYIAGPIITFNDFVWQLRRPLIISPRSIINYFFRFLICALTMELVLHFMYVVAIKDTKAWLDSTPAQISMIGFWNLAIVWLKLLIPWRFFRLWSLMGGIDPPENMIRCVANNYSMMSFWRSWHRSYNLWLLRYIYIPVGGAKRVLLNSLLVFSFVALWHDLTFRLLAWGWLVTLFIAPEILARYLFPASRFSNEPWYRHLCAAGGTLNLLLMMAANLVGFVIGIEGLEFFVKQLFGTSEGLRFVVGAMVCMFVGVQLMFEYREEEMRAGIFRKC